MSPSDRAVITRQLSILVGLWFIIICLAIWNNPFQSHAAESKGAPCQAGAAQLCVPIRDADRERFKAIPAEFTAAQSQLQAAQNWQAALREEQETIRLRACLTAGLADAECGGFIGDKVGVNPKPVEEKKK